jgi:hypothetical protein
MRASYSPEQVSVCKAPGLGGLSDTCSRKFKDYFGSENLEFFSQQARLSRQTPDGIPESPPSSQIRPIREALPNVALNVGCRNPFQGTGRRFVNGWDGELELERVGWNLQEAM